MFSSYYMSSTGHVYPNKSNQDDVPVVVISPEDREQVERLIERMAQARVWAVMPSDVDSMSDYRADQMQAALRSLIAPPKPDEPTGLGAVVEDASGRPWVFAGDVDSSGTWWYNAAEPERWNEINAVRVLSEGVTP